MLPTKKDFDDVTAPHGGQIVQTSATEFGLLISLLHNPGRVFSREQLLNMVWGISTDLETWTVEVPIRRLKRKLERAGGKNPIRTVRGFGYSMECD